MCGKNECTKYATDRLTEKQEIARKANEKGFSDLILSMDPKTESGKMMINMISSAETEKLPEGCLQMAWELLIDEFEPKSGVNRLAKRNEFDQMNLTDWKENPVLYNQIGEDKNGICASWWKND